MNHKAKVKLAWHEKEARQEREPHIPIEDPDQPYRTED